MRHRLLAYAYLERLGIFLIALFVASFGSDTSAAPAQVPLLSAPAIEDETASESLDPGIPRDAASIVSALAKLSEEREQLQRALASLIDVEARSSTLDIEAELVDAFTEYLNRFEKESFFRSRVLVLQSRLISSRSRLRDVMERTSTDLEVAQSMQEVWRRRRDGWSRGALRAVLEGDERGEFAPQIQRGRILIEESLAELDRTTKILAVLQERALNLHSQANALLDRLQTELQHGRETRLRRQEVALWSHAAGNELAQSDFTIVARRATWWDPGFIARSRGTFFAHLMLAALVFLLARTLHVDTSTKTLQGRLWSHPLTLAAFVSTSLIHVAYQPAPPAVEAAIWGILGSTGAALAAWAMPRGARRRAGVVMASGYPLLAVIDTLGMPSVILRWCVVLGAAFGALSALWLRRRFVRSREDWVWRIPLSVAAGAMAVAALAEITGFVSLGRYLLGATARSGFLALTILFLVALVHSAMEAGIVWSAAKVSARWRGVVPHFGRRIGWLIEAILVVQGCLTILNTWELTPPANEAWMRIGRYSFGGIGLDISVASIALAALSLYLARQVSWVIELVLDGTVLERHDFDAGIANSIKTLVRYVLTGVGVIVAMGLLGIELRNIAIVAGALGIGIGFGLQSVVADFTSGLILLLERPLRTGDNVIIADQWGVVKQIGLRSTVLRLLDESELVVPNSHMTTEKVQNFTLSSRAVRLFVPVGVAFGSNVELVFKTLEEVAAGDDEVLIEPPPEVLFMTIGERALEFELRVWIRRAETRLAVRSRLLRTLDRYFRERGIVIPYPQRDLHLRSIDADVLPRRATGDSGSEPSSPRDGER